MPALWGGVQTGWFESNTEAFGRSAQIRDSWCQNDSRLQKVWIHRSVSEFKQHFLDENLKQHFVMIQNNLNWCILGEVKFRLKVWTHQVIRDSKGFKSHCYLVMIFGLIKIQQWLFPESMYNL
jgi:hypothetical protein